MKVKVTLCLPNPPINTGFCLNRIIAYKRFIIAQLALTDNATVFTEDGVET